MASSRRHDDLLRQIPSDVRERAEKAGVTKIDWYAGRLTKSGGTGFSSVPEKRHEELRQAARSRRLRRRADKVERVKAPIVNVIAWLRSRPGRMLRHTS